MPHQPENNDWSDSSSGRGRRNKADREKDATLPNMKAGRADPAKRGGAGTPAGPGKGTARKIPLEDLNDREDLSERNLNDRNWL
jgi:hypothetical protein